MKTTANTIRKIAAIAAAMTMTLSTLGATVSAQATSLYDDYTTVQFADERISVSNESVTIDKGNTAYVIVTVNDGSRNLKAVSTNTDTAKAAWSTDGFCGDAIILNIKGLSRGTAKIKIQDKETGVVLKTINVTVESDEVMRSSSYSDVFSVYSFTTGCYYMNMSDALAESMNNASTLYFGKVTFMGTASSEYSYYNMYTGLYYPNLDMAVAAANGNRAYVKQVELSSKTYGNGFTYYNFKTNAYYKSYGDAAAAANMSASSIYNGMIDATVNADANHRYYSGATGRYYTNYNRALAASDGYAGWVSQVEIEVKKDSDTYSSEFCYYSFATFRYYNSWSAANEASGYDAAAIYYGRISYDIKSSIEYSYLCKYDYKYYPNYEMALAAAHGVAADVEFCF